MNNVRCIVKLLSLCLFFVFTLTVAGTSHAQQEETSGDGIKQYFTEKRSESVCDFTGKIVGWRVNPKTSYSVSDGTLTCLEGKEFTLSSLEMLGDQYGILPAEMSFKMKLTGGSVVIGLRNLNETTKENETGLRFRITADQIAVSEPGAGFTAETSLPFPIDSECVFTVRDSRNKVELFIEKDGRSECAATVIHNSFGTENQITAFEKTGETKLSPSGYCALYVDGLQGYIDDLKYTVSELTYNGAGQAVDYTYWVASDDLDRTSPTFQETGGIRQDKYVGVFYFISHVGGGWPIIDHTQIFLDRGVDGLKKFLKDREQTSYGNYWSEPYFGYYVDVDEWVLRKHAQMLCDAGVDFIFVDISNGETYKDAHQKLFETWYKIRQEGGQTPQICFLTGDTAGRLEDELAILRTTVYSDANMEKYKDLMFQWDGKPLIFGKTRDTVTAAQQELLDRFTIRGCWAWVDKDGYWNWLAEVPQYKGRDSEGNFEQISVTMGHHASTSKGRSYTSAGGQPNNNLQDFEFSSRTAQYGYCFEEQFKSAIQMDPSVILITGWNEWTAGQMPQNSVANLANTQVYKYTFVDQFNPEFSRDGEPMRIRDGVGYGDNYYYQMANYIRLYKGTNEMKTADARATIDIYGAAQQWDNILPEFTDTTGDTAPRNELAYDASFRYVNNTGRNDIQSAKVAQDEQNIYFMVRTVKNIILDDGENWMNLYLDIDQDCKTGWEGYDYVINRARSNGKMSVQRFVDNSWKFEDVGEAEYTISGNTLMLKLPKTLIATNVKYLSFDFKWADNSTVSGNVMEFMDLGDAAPNGRFNVRFVGDRGFYSGGIKKTAVICAVAAAVAAAAGAVAYIIFKKKKHI